MENVLSDTLVQDIDPLVNSWHLCYKYKHGVFFIAHDTKPR